MCSNLSPFFSGSSRLLPPKPAPKVGRTRLATHSSIIFQDKTHPYCIFEHLEPHCVNLYGLFSVRLPTFTLLSRFRLLRLQIPLPPPSKVLLRQFLYIKTRGWSIHQPDISNSTIVVGLMDSSLYTCPSSVSCHGSHSRPLRHTSSGLMQSLV